MVYSSRVLALLIALCIAIVTTLFLSLIESVSGTALIVTFGIGFSFSYLLIFIVLEFLIFREIKKMYKLINKLKKKELLRLEKAKPGKLNPFKDISDAIYSFADLKQKEIDELRKLERFRTEFIADISHELKTPIFAAQGFVHTLLDGAVKDKSVRNRFLKKAAKSLDGLDMLVQDLLVLSQIETGQIKMSFTYANLLEVTEDVFEQFEDKATKRNIKLRVEKPGQKPTVYADRQRIQQVITNLVSNAITHSHEGTEVIVSFDVAKKFVTTHIRDFGVGIGPEHTHRIFERFYRVDKSRSREKGGTGLGLAIVKHILENHGTHAEVDSKRDEGSDFHFRLPRHMPDGSAPDTEMA